MSDIRTRPATAEYRDNWDRMFGEPERRHVCQKCDCHWFAPDGQACPRCTPAAAPDMVPMPKGRVRYNGSGTPCDMLKGPCSCGAWHTGEEPTLAVDEDGRTAAYVEHRKHCGNCQGCDWTNEMYVRCDEGRRLLGQKPRYQP